MHNLYTVEINPECNESFPSLDATDPLVVVVVVGEAFVTCELFLSLFICSP